MKISSRSQKKVTSHSWRGILIGRDIIMSNAGWEVGNCESINIWDKLWLRGYNPERSMGPAPLEFWSLAVSDLVLPASREWNVDTIQLVLPFEEHKIRSIKPSVSGAPDKLSWLGASLGNYSTQSGYAAAISKRSDVMDIAQEHLNFNWKKEIWSLKTSLKTKLFAWKIIHGAIPTGEALRATAAWDTIKLCCNQIRCCLEWKLKYCRSRLDSGFSEQNFIVLGLGAPCM